MIDPNSMMGAFTGSQQPVTQQTVAPSQPQATPVPQAKQSDALDMLDSIVQAAGEQQPSAQVVPQPPQPPQVTTVDPVPVSPQTNPQTQPQPQAQVQSPLQSDPSAQVVMQAVQAIPDPLNPLNPAPASAKETFERPAAPDATSVDVGGAMQHVETEKNPEIPVEVEAYLQRVQDFSAQQPQEVVIADGTTEQANAGYPSQPVVVLPITQEEEQSGQRKSPRNSIRWLVEWSHKIVKMFAGKVIYRHVEEK